MRGQPTKYKKKQILETIEKLAQVFCPDDKDIAAYIGIRPETFSRWKKSHPEIVTVLDRGKAIAKIGLNTVLVQKAKGGNMTALIFVLTNKFPDDWQDRRAVFSNTNVFSPNVRPLKNSTNEELDAILTEGRR
ncbi:MAG: hypothetical protein PHG69_05710 [Candidatus Omnitrophica bacterium]|nr:hypothetical protein [Candidatus Omnitrophota bacterium]